MTYRTVTRANFEEAIRILADTPAIESFKFMKDDAALTTVAHRVAQNLANAVRYADKQARAARVQNLEG